jgi:hypothetical protein
VFTCEWGITQSCTGRLVRYYFVRTLNRNTPSAVVFPPSGESGFRTVLQQRDMLHTFPTILRKLCCSIFRKSSCQTLNHSRYFRDPTTGICTNSFEGYWSRLKGMIRRLGVTQSPFLPEYFDMFLWWQHYGPTAADRFRNVLLHISEKYTFCIHLLFFYPLGSRGEVRMRS